MKHIKRENVGLLESGKFYLPKMIEIIFIVIKNFVEI